MKNLQPVIIPSTYNSGWGRVKEFNSKKTGKALGDAFIRFGKRAGLLPLNPPCASCSKVVEGTHWHHDSYDEPAAVIPLCPRCHRLRHSELGWGNNPGGFYLDRNALSRQALYYRDRREAGLCARCGVHSTGAFCEECKQTRLANMGRKLTAKAEGGAA